MDLINMCFQIFKFISNVLSMISSMIMSSIIASRQVIINFMLECIFKCIIAVLNNQKIEPIYSRLFSFLNDYGSSNRI